MTEDPKLLLTNALSNLNAALESISSKCTEECPPNCEEIAHADSEPDCEAAADEILEAQRRIQEFLNAENRHFSIMVNSLRAIAGTPINCDAGSICEYYCECRSKVARATLEQIGEHCEVRV